MLEKLLQYISDVLNVYIQKIILITIQILELLVV
jgi:hypothetical protein